MLVAYILYADGFTTMATIAILFASDIFNSSALTLGILLIEVPICAGIGVYVFEKIRRRFNIATKSMVYFHLGGIILVAAYALVGFIPGTPFGLVQEVELYGVAFVYGLNLGIMSYSRALFAMLCPKGKEAVFFSIYELSDKGSSWIGPLVVAGLNEAFGSMRYGVFFIVVLCTVGLIVLTRVDVDEGVLQVRQPHHTKVSSVESE
jgi:UMF1 family MFS transporter